jgi:hypothetical protein
MDEEDKWTWEFWGFDHRKKGALFKLGSTLFRLKPRKKLAT